MEDEKLNDAVPDSVILKYVLQENGKLKAYIEELESRENQSLRHLENKLKEKNQKIKELKAKALTTNDTKRLNGLIQLACSKLGISIEKLKEEYYK